jgi:hypothetical protein
METRIWVRNGYKEINPELAPTASRELDSFLWTNNAPKCFLRGQGGWYKITKENRVLFVNRVLYTMSYQEWLKIAIDDKFTANIKN